jgi:hypothetical protein
LAGEFTGVIREVALLAVERDGRIDVLKSISLSTA